MAKSESGFTAEERAAMKQRAAELRASKGLKGAAKKARELDACIEAIGELDGTDRRVAERFHIVVSEEAPHLDAKTWYGMPAYAADGTVVTFVQPASKFDTRYLTIGFNDSADLDDGAVWETVFAVTDWNDDIEARFRALVRKAAPAAK